MYYTFWSHDFSLIALQHCNLSTALKVTGSAEGSKEGNWQYRRQLEVQKAAGSTEIIY